MKKIVFLLFAVLLLQGCTRTEAAFDDFARCLSSKGIKMYGTDTCPHCKNQKEFFKGSFDLISYVNCESKPAECQKQEITGYPTWIIDGKKYPGERSLSALAELSGCSIVEEAAEK